MEATVHVPDDLLAPQDLYGRSLAYLEGRGVQEDLGRAFELNAMAARQGHHDAVLAMGWFYLGGGGFQQDYEKARKWYRKSARFGEPKAMFSLGRIAYDEEDYAGSLMWFTRAFNKGHVRSLYWIGKHHWFGRGVPQDKTEAIRIFQLAAKKRVLAARRVLKYLARNRSKS